MCVGRQYDPVLWLEPFLPSPTMEPGTGLKAVGLCLCLRNRAAHPHLELFPYSFLYGNVQKKRVFSTQTSANAILTWGEKSIGWGK